MVIGLILKLEFAKLVILFVLLVIMDRLVPLALQEQNPEKMDSAGIVTVKKVTKLELIMSVVL